jgi:glucokinase
MAKSIGIDVGGTNLRIGVFDDLHLIQEIRFQADFSAICKAQTPTHAWQTVLDTTAHSVQDVLAQYPEVQHIGIGFPGFIDPKTQTISQSPNLPGLSNVNLAHDLADILQKKVIVENDALAAAYGEYCLVDKPVSGLIYIGLGTGLGGGLIYSGAPFAGSHGVAMEVGHIIVCQNGRLCGCGNRGCVEQYASASGVANSYLERTQLHRSAFEIAQLADAGDEVARLCYQLAGEYLAHMLASVLKVLDVPNVVVGGGMRHAWHLLYPSFQSTLEADLIPALRQKVTVTPSKTEDIAGMLGASLLARHW